MATPLSLAEEQICALPCLRTTNIQERYVGGGTSSYRFLNLSVPQVRQFAKSSFLASRQSPTWQDWNQVWQGTEIYDLLLAAVIWAGDAPLKEQWAQRATLLAWSKKANNWALADSLCSIYACLFEYQPRKFAPVLERWSKSKDPWQRRMSIVSLFYYSRSRSHLPSFSLAKKLILRQLHDPHFYVQKGVGWALRECWNVYPQETFKLLKKISAEIPPAGWTAATEKLSKKDKALLTELRKRSGKK